jgi:hypothetical protein
MSADAVSPVRCTEWMDDSERRYAAHAEAEEALAAFRIAEIRLKAAMQILVEFVPEFKAELSSIDPRSVTDTAEE